MYYYSISIILLLLSISVQSYINVLVLYIELLVEYYCYYISILLLYKLGLIVTISELIIIISIVCISICNINYNKGIVDGIILNDSNYNVNFNNIYLGIVSNIIICIWCYSNIYICYKINYIIIDISINVCIILFIELQLKEYINYNSYMNSSISVSIIFIMLGIHLLHISICSIIINYLYIISIIIYIVLYIIFISLILY